MMMSRLTLLAACVAATCLCSRASAQAATPAPADSAHAPAAMAPAHAPRRDANLITADEIARETAHNAYEVVTRLRPRWLHPYAAHMSRNGETDQVWVYLDGNRMGQIEELGHISAE